MFSQNQFRRRVRASSGHASFSLNLDPFLLAHAQCEIDHAVLRGGLEPIRALYEDVKRKALMRLEYEGLHRAEAIVTAGTRFHRDPAGFAMERYAYYVCFKCEWLSCVTRMRTQVV